MARYANGMERKALYPGSFDPITNGHLDVLARSFQLADTVIAAIGLHPGKVPIFSFEERREMIMEAGKMVRPENSQLQVISFDGLVVEAARSENAPIIIRGLRDGTDLDYEMQMAGMNAVLAPGVETVFLPASPLSRPITATLVRQIAKMGGDIRPFVPDFVAERLYDRFGGQ